ncbi:MAG: nucleoside deaminase [Cyclobacteriaceae bacterium]|nr:nucleoside deaminase [Cyclobacteriaceae bacterium]MCH8517127.1 nucleoside deaminase [Cyclobacteriaceae bacterium]
MAEEKHMREAIRLSLEMMLAGKGGPFGAVVVKNGEIVGIGYNQVTSTNDPTAHAEVVAIRDACKNLDTYQLDDCEIYTSCEPCPMCLGAIYWARPLRVYYGNTKEDAKAIGFDDQFIYEELEKKLNERSIPMLPMLRNEALKAFEAWQENDQKKEY